MLPSVDLVVFLSNVIDAEGVGTSFLDVQLPKYGFLGWWSIDVECQRHRRHRRVSMN